MKNYPNQASSFPRIRDTLYVIDQLNQASEDATSDEVLGYACAQEGVYTFRGLDGTQATQRELDERIAQERKKPAASQGVRTFARELRRTLRDMGWVDHDAHVTAEGQALLASAAGSIEEQALLVEGLLSIEVTEKGGVSPHHPIPVLLKLLAHRPTQHRDGLELALEPTDDSDAEFNRVRHLYDLPRAQRMSQLGITDYQRANAVKIFPTLAVAAGLVVEDEDGFFSLSQEGWQIIGQPTTPATARTRIAKRAKRTTVGKLVTSKTIAARRSSEPPRTLTKEEQQRAAERLRERTFGHQALVRAMAQLIGDGDGELFEDEFAYDMLWVPFDATKPAILFEMKTITSDVDAHARIRAAVGQLSYYEYFHAKPRLGDREVVRCAVFDHMVPIELRDYLTHENVGAIHLPTTGLALALNPRGQEVLDLLP
ncbi:hypothetical protein [Blastococcus sp. SYSU DS0533]